MVNNLIIVGTCHNKYSFINCVIYSDSILLYRIEYNIIKLF